MKAHVSDAKKVEVKKIIDLTKKYDVIGIVDLTGLPSAQFQKIKAKLKDSLLIKVSKKRLMRIALKDLEKDKKGISKLEPFLEKCMPAIIFTNQDPFKLSSILNKNKSRAPAKAGQTSPSDIVIPAGPTPFAPGPVIGELGQAGIATGIEAGKIIVKNDTTIVKEGEYINPRTADILARFGIEPIEIGLNLTAVYEKGQIYDKNVLSIDEEGYKNRLQQAYMEAFNLAIYSSYVTKETIKELLQKADSETKALTKSADILTSDDVKPILAQAETVSENLKNKLNIEEKPKETTEKEEEPKKEEKKEVTKQDKTEDGKEDIKEQENKATPKTEKQESKEKKKPPLPYSKEAESDAKKIIDNMVDKAIGDKK